MNRIDRRDFLRWLGAGVGGAVGSALLSACGQRATPLPTATTLPPTPTHAPPTATLAPGETPPPTTAAPPTAVPTSAPPYIAVARGGDPEALVERALSALGGIERFVRPGNDVIIKPNICIGYHSYEYAATTNPWVVGALTRLCLGAGALRVRVMDYPFGSTADEAYIRSGIQEQVLAAGGEMELMTAFKFIATDLPDAVDLRRCDIYDDVLTTDVLINVPIAKHHNLARLTLGMKNLMGVIYDRPAMHANLGQRLADLTSRIRPALTVIDAVRILVDHGPTGGSLNDVRQMDTLIASPDIVAADAYAAATLFDMPPERLAYVEAGVAMGLGRSDLENLAIEEIAVGG
ncbi:MAG: DUF362 domain-containing protein [Anaerolineae bacterium]|nr:DUF362 domain-containing protein [Anaerolineae bacterium]